MRFNDDTRTRLSATVTTDFDPATATVEVKVDATWYPATWTATATTTGARWTRAARTTGYFAGPSAVASGATVLALGRHPTETRITNGGDILVVPSTPIDVVA